MRYGTLDRSGERWRLTYERRFPHPVEKVWRAITETAHLAAWFPCEMHGPREVGGALRFVFPFPEAPVLTGEVLVFDPPFVLEFTWGEDRLRFELSPTDEGCLLRFSVVLDERGKAARDGAGWHDCLEHLGLHLDGVEATPGTYETWRDVQPEYERRFGPEASSIGPPDWAVDAGG